jgi:3-phenylpropionate/trans-cinnamate dioxygenase ferredoxin subunit
MAWTDVADVEEIEVEDVIEVSVGENVLAVYRIKDGYFASDGICTHEYACLADGFVIGNEIECPKHQGRFDIRSGACKGAPVSVPVQTDPTRGVDGWVQVDLGDGERQ